MTTMMANRAGEQASFLQEHRCGNFRRLRILAPVLALVFAAVLVYGVLITKAGA